MRCVFQLFILLSHQPSGHHLWDKKSKMLETFYFMCNDSKMLLFVNSRRKSPRSAVYLCWIKVYWNHELSHFCLFQMSGESDAFTGPHLRTRCGRCSQSTSARWTDTVFLTVSVSGSCCAGADILSIPHHLQLQHGSLYCLLRSSLSWCQPPLAFTNTVPVGSNKEPT